MHSLLPRSLVAIGFLGAITFAQLQELPLGSGPQVPECVDNCRIDFFNTTSVTRDCTSAEWDCNCKYVDLWKYMACCIQDYCGDIDVEDADDTLRGYCARINVKGEFPSLLECKDDEPGTTSTVSNPTGTASRRQTTTTADTTQTDTITTSTRIPIETSEAGKVEPTAEGREDDAYESNDGGLSKSSTTAVGVGLGVGIPICAVGLGFIAFIIWRRNKARQNMVDSPVSEHSFYSSAGKTPKVEPGESPFLSELHSECRRAELPG